MDGWFTCERLDEFFARVVRARLSERLPLSMNFALLVAKSKLQNRQTRQRAREVAKIHYDLPVEVFEATFDRRLTGSCGYWKEAQTLDEAQDGKLDLICRKIGLRSGERVLDIGCGWGAFMGFAAERYRARCTGVTVSKEQVEYGRKRYAGLAVEPRLEDYRDCADGPFDHIVSMGMFEHVGPKNYRVYFETARRLSARGWALPAAHDLGERAVPSRSVDRQIHLPQRRLADRRADRHGRARAFRRRGRA